MMACAGDIHEGGCLCGAIRYRISGPIESVAHCHCSMCRRASGAVVLTFVTVPRDCLTFTQGGPEIYKSSGHDRRGFCDNCGGQITFTSTQEPTSIDIALATLDCAGDHPADRHIWTSNKLKWLRLDDHLPAHEGETPDAPT